MGGVPTLAEFLANSPPGDNRIVNNVVSHHKHSLKSATTAYLLMPTITTECHSDQCSGIRNFWCMKDENPPRPLVPGKDCFAFLAYQCQNCLKFIKTFAIKFMVPADGYIHAEVTKLGEEPPFGPRVPTRVNALIAEDRELFFKGRRCENQGLGIAAFSYYRRVVENQKCRFLSEIIKAAKRLGTPQDQVDKLDAAKRETQFSKAIDSVKDSIPRELLIRGHNPLTLLHSAVSEGLHAHTDEQCLNSASAVRLVLFELAEKLGEALKEQSELDAAVSRLLQKK